MPAAAEAASLGVDPRNDTLRGTVRRSEQVDRDWVGCPGMAVRNGALAFAPDRDKGYDVGVTRQDDFRDFSVVAAVGVWEHGDEAGEYRALRVEAPWLMPDVRPI